MARTWTTGQNIIKPDEFGEVDAWGTLLNTSLDMIDTRFSGYKSITLTGSYSLTDTDGAVSDVNYPFINFGGTAGAVTVTLPNKNGAYRFANNTNGIITLQQNGVGSAITLPINVTADVYTVLDVGASLHGTPSKWALISTTSASGTNTDITASMAFFTRFLLTVEGVAQASGGAQNLQINLEGSGGAYATAAIGSIASATLCYGAFEIDVPAAAYGRLAGAVTTAAISQTAPISTTGISSLSLPVIWDGGTIRMNWSGGASFSAGSFKLYGAR